MSNDPDLKVSRALDVFNSSEHIQSVAGIARSLGEPVVSAIPNPKDSVVTVVVAWDLSWYRYEVDLANEAAGPRLTDRGYDPAQLGELGARDNVSADEWGQLRLVGAAA